MVNRNITNNLHPSIHKFYTTAECLHKSILFVNPPIDSSIDYDLYISNSLSMVILFRRWVPSVLFIVHQWWMLFMYWFDTQAAATTATTIFLYHDPNPVFLKPQVNKSWTLSWMSNCNSFWLLQGQALHFPLSPKMNATANTKHILHEQEWKSSGQGFHSFFHFPLVTQNY